MELKETLQQTVQQNAASQQCSVFYICAYQTQQLLVNLGWLFHRDGTLNKLIINVF